MPTIPHVSLPLQAETLTALAIVRDELDVPPYNTPPEKLEKAYQACLEQRIIATEASDVFLVESSDEEEGSYTATLQGACTCPHGRTHPGALWGCYHPIAAKMSQRLAQNQRRSPAPKERPMEPSPPSPSHMTHAGAVLHEAPYSLNVTVVDDHGYELQLTVRKTNEADFAKAVLGLTSWCAKHGLLPRKRFEGPPSGNAPPAAGAAEGAPVCQWHGALKESEKVKGMFFCPKKMADGTYCKETWPKREAV